MKKKYIKIFIIIALIVIVCLVIFSSCSISLQDTFSFAHSEYFIGESIYKNEKYLEFPYGKEFKESISNLDFSDDIFVSDFNCEIYKSDFTGKVYYAFYILKLKYNPDNETKKKKLMADFDEEYACIINSSKIEFSPQKDSKSENTLYIGFDDETIYLLFAGHNAAIWKCHFVPDLGHIRFTEKNGVARVDYEGKSFITPY